MIKNILFLVSDSLRQDFLATSQTHTPTLDRLRSDGIEFTRARSPGPGTAVSMPSLLSGAFPFTYGYKGINQDRPMLAPVLSDEGFCTAGYHSNGWCSSANGFDKGFDDFKYFQNQRREDLTIKAGQRLMREMTSQFPNFPRLTSARRTKIGEWGSRQIVRGLARTVPQARNDVTADASALHNRLLNWFDQTDGPRFIWNQYMDTHFPYMAPGSEFSPSEQLRLNYLMTRNRIADVSISPSDQRSLLELYREEIAYLDRELGTLLHELKSKGELSQTIIIFTADHGELLGEYGKFGHKSARLGSPLTHVPLVMWCDELPSKTIQSPISLVDVVPTIYDLIGVPEPAGLDGQSLSPVIKANESPVTPAISEMGHDPFDFNGSPSPETTVVSIETDKGMTVADWLHDDLPSRDSSEYERLKKRRDQLQPTDDAYSDLSNQDAEAKQRLQDLGYLE